MFPATPEIAASSRERSRTKTSNPSLCSKAQKNKGTDKIPDLSLDKKEISWVVDLEKSLLADGEAGKTSSIVEQVFKDSSPQIPLVEAQVQEGGTMDYSQ